MQSRRDRPGGLLQKCVVIGAWLVILLVHKNFRFARIGLYASRAACAVLMLLHFGILASGIKPHDPRVEKITNESLDPGVSRLGKNARTQIRTIQPQAGQISRRADPPTMR